MAKGDALTGFEVAGSRRKVSARQQPKSTAQPSWLSSPAVAEPVYVRYGWANSPQCNLFNGEGLPASPFTSEK